MRTVENSFKQRVIAEVNTRTIETALTAAVARVLFKYKSVATLLSAAYMDGLVDRVCLGREYGYFHLMPNKSLPPLLEGALNRAYRATCNPCEGARR